MVYTFRQINIPWKIDYDPISYTFASQTMISIRQDKKLSTFSLLLAWLAYSEHCCKGAFPLISTYTAPLTAYSHQETNVCFHTFSDFQPGLVSVFTATLATLPLNEIHPSRNWYSPVSVMLCPLLLTHSLPRTMLLVDGKYHWSPYNSISTTLSRVVPRTNTRICRPLDVLFSVCCTSSHSYSATVYRVLCVFKKRVRNFPKLLPNKPLRLMPLACYPFYLSAFMLGICRN